jgi:hypothetical protein
MEPLVSRLVRLALCFVVALSCLSAATARAQSTAQAASAGEQTASGGLWLVAGGAWVTTRGDCQTCEEDYPYRHSGSVMANIGYPIRRQLNVGAEFTWLPVETPSVRMNITHIDAVAQFRPWASSGFFVNGGAGMAFVRNWVEVTNPSSINSKALSVVIGAGWRFQPTRRVGFELFAAQHATALGDLQTNDGQVPDVMGNSWSLGAALVFH